MYLQSHFSKTNPMKFRGFFTLIKPKSIYTCITNIQSRQQLLSEVIKMKVQLRNLLNPVILNAGKWIGFFGDSEYVDENGDVKFGFWSFTGIVDEKDVEYVDEKYGIFTLDDEVDEEDFYNNNLDFPIMNDNGQLCAVQFTYGDD